MNTPDDVTGPINLGNPEEITIRELADMVVRLTGSRSRIVHTKLPKDDPRRRQPDIAKAGKVLGWIPTTPMETGLEKTIDYFDRLLGSRQRAAGA